MKESMDPNIPEKTPQKKSGKKWIVAIIIFILLGGIFAFWVLRPFIMSNIAHKFIDSGNQLLKEEKYNEATVDYQKSLNFDKTNIEAYKGLNEVFVHLQEYTEAESVLRDGINHISTNEDKVVLYNAIKTVYQTAGKGEEALQKINDEAFNVTGKREFGEKYEKAAAKYLRMISVFESTTAIVPAFESIENVNKDWLFSSFAWKTESTTLNSDVKGSGSMMPFCSLEDMSVNVHKYFNPEINLPEDYAFQPYLGEAMIKYDPESKVALHGSQELSGYVNNDFIVTDFYKKDGNYHIEGVFLALAGNNNNWPKSGKASCDVYIDEIGKGEVSRRVGTATASNVHNFPPRLEEPITYDFDLKSLDTDVYHYVLSDNPGGTESNAKEYDGKEKEGSGPFFLVSRTKGKKLSEITTDIKSSSPGIETINVNVVALEKYEPILKAYRELVVNGKSSNRNVQVDLANSGVYPGDTLSYLLKDINEDGAPELFIASTKGGSVLHKFLVGEAKYNIYDMYTLDMMGDPKPLLGEKAKASMGVRGTYAICKNNAIFFRRSGGATYYSVGAHRLVEPTDIKAHIIEELFVDSQKKNNTKYYLTENNQNPISETEAMSMMAKMKETYIIDNDLDWIVF